MKQIKKMLSLWLTIAMILSMFSAGLSVEASYDTVSGTSATVFGKSAFTWNYTFTNTSDDAYDGTYAHMSWGGMTFTATKTFYVEKADEYALNVYAASSITNEWISDLQFQIDDGTKVTFHSGNSTVESLEKPVGPTSDGGVFRTKNIKYNNSIALGEGLHTIKFIVPQTSQYGQKKTEAYFTFDCATLTPTDKLLRINDTTTIGNSSFAWVGGTEYTSDNAYDKTYRRETWGSSTHTATKSFYIEKTDEYALNVYAASSRTNDYASDMQFQIDGGSAVTFHSENSTVEALASPCITNDVWTPKNIKYNNTVVLGEGLHTITFIFPKNSEYGAKRTEGIYTFDCATLTPTDKLLRINDTTTIGNSSFAWSKNLNKSSDNAYDKTYSYNDWGTATRTATKTFYVERADEYALSVYAAASVTNSALSDLQFQIDDESTVTFTNSNSTLESLTSPCKTGTFEVKNIKYNNSIVLDEGLHTITFIVPLNSPVSGRTNVSFAFDCATLTPTNGLLTVSNTDTTTIGKSSFAWNYDFTNTSDNAYDGTYALMNGGLMTFKATKTFYVEEDAEYMLNVYGASSVTNEWISDMKFTIDDRDAVTFKYANTTVQELESPCVSSGYFTVKNIKYNNSILLEEGLHTITFTIPMTSANGRQDAAFAFDCASFTPYPFGINETNGIYLKNWYIADTGNVVLNFDVGIEGSFDTYMLLAAYENSNKLKKVYMAQDLISVNDKTAEIPVEDEITSDYNYKIFVWDSLDNLRPLTHDVSMEKKINLHEISNVVDVHHDTLNSYLADSYGEVSKYADGKFTAPIGKYLSLRWTYENQNVKNFVLRVSENADMSDAWEYTTSVAHYDLDNLKVGTKYFWNVTAKYEDGTTYTSEISSFTTEDQAPRVINVEGVTNMRDIGGWHTEDGNRVKQGLIYRSGRYDMYSGDNHIVVITEKGIDTMVNQLGIKTEIDFRDEYVQKSKSVLGDGVKLYYRTVNYANDYLSQNHDNIKAVFELFADSGNYPLAYHCQVGADRTGVISYLLNGLLGVSKEDLLRDYLMTNFSNIDGARSLSDIENKYVKTLDEYEGESLSDKIYNYLNIEVGISTDALDNIKNNLIEQ